MKVEYNSFYETYHFTMDGGEQVNLSEDEFWRIVQLGKKLNIKNFVVDLIKNHKSFYGMSAIPEIVLQDEKLMKGIVNDLYECWTEKTDYLSGWDEAWVTKNAVYKKSLKDPELQEKVNEEMLSFLCSEYQYKLLRKENGSVELYKNSSDHHKYKDVKDALCHHWDLEKIACNGLRSETTYIRALIEPKFENQLYDIYYRAWIEDDISKYNDDVYLDKFTGMYHIKLEDGEQMNLSENSFWKLVEYGKKINIQKAVKDIIDSKYSIYGLGSDVILLDEFSMNNIVDELYENHLWRTDAVVPIDEHEDFFYAFEKATRKLVEKNFFNILERDSELRDQVNDSLLKSTCSQHKMQVTKKEDGSIEICSSEHGTNKYRNVQEALIGTVNYLNSFEIVTKSGQIKKPYYSSYKATYVEFLQELYTKEKAHDPLIETEGVAIEDEPLSRTKQRHETHDER